MVVKERVAAHPMSADAIAMAPTSPALNEAKACPMPKDRAKKVTCLMPKNMT